jgi:hypothetical protein
MCYNHIKPGPSLNKRLPLATNSPDLVWGFNPIYVQKMGLAGGFRRRRGRRPQGHKFREAEEQKQAGQAPGRKVKGSIRMRIERRSK